MHKTDGETGETETLKPEVHILWPTLEQEQERVARYVKSSRKRAVLPN